ncbi:ATP-grasp domain-containing protein [Tissierella creatinophila]|uniref:2-oxoglutarate carboxylase small subunit n=1 Tax=Tissierella creatinophila DSM 6911 TaxID=1123403 RepID=A0A1U7M672_TISCR|nr:ATP-grasp domain-containing protein [Tissierella creatinophila]OLS02775.1 2-oxoglutarate carboxylase small subunit [Tissierella creatinophila DSM 6911]
MNYVFISPDFPSNFKYFALRLAQQGICVLGLGSENYDFLEPELKGALTEYYRVEDMEDYDQVLKACGYFTFKYGKIDRIESHNEHWLYQDACLRTDFNVFGFKEKDMGSIKYKSKMKEVFKKVGVPVARGKVTRDIDEAKKFIDEVGYPVCVKPDIGVGAANTFKLNNDEELDWFFSNELEVDYIMEEFIEGDIHTFDGLVDRNGKMVFMNSFIYDNGVMDIVNDNLDMYYYNQIEIPEDLKKYGLDIVKAFGVKEGFFHLEFFRTEEGKLIALEANLRPPGGLSMDLFNYSTDSDLYLAYAQLVSGDTLELQEKAPYCCVYIGRKDDEGIKHVNSIEGALIKYKDLFVYNGPIASIFSAAIGNYGIILRANDREALEEAIQFIKLREIS